MTDQPTIEIRRDGAGFGVTVVPPDLAYPVERYDDVRRARGAAGCIRLVTGWVKVDLTGPNSATGREALN